MGLDTIFFWGTAAGNMAALAPTTAVIKGNSGDAYIVGVHACGTADASYTLSAPGDPRWEAAGIQFGGHFNGALTAVSQNMELRWLPTKIPIKCGTTLQVAMLGAADTICLVYVDYPALGEPFKPRDPCLGQPVGFEVTKVFTAAGNCTAVWAAPILVNTDNDATFQRGRSYTPVKVAGPVGAAGFATPIVVGIANTKLNLNTFWVVGNTHFINGGVNEQYLPYGLGTVDGGETQYVHMADYTAETPIITITYAYTA